MRHRKITRSQIAAFFVAPFVLVVIALLFVIVVPLQGRPFIHRSRRMRDADTAFWLYKIRTMRCGNGLEETALGGHQASRVTRIGRLLRRTRLDELPQIVNVLKGDIAFIGPRPPLPGHVAACPVRYRRLLDAVRPGITGLSTVFVHRREERILSRCNSALETEREYLRRCLPVKLRLDMIYVEHRSLGLDLLILWWTFARLFSVRSAVALPEAGHRLPVAEQELPAAA